MRAAIGHIEPVADESAIRFSQRFYELLIDGDSVGRALHKAANQMVEQGLPGFNQVVLEGDQALLLSPHRQAGELPSQVNDGIPSNCWLPTTGYFCGRSEEYAGLVADLDDNQLTGLGIWGIGGMGKTALAKEIAHRNVWRYGAGGAVFIDIRDLPDVDRTVAGLLRRAQAGLAPSLQAPDPAMGLVQHLRTAGPGLIVLDNLEDLPAAEHAALARFVRDLPRNGSRVLITARTRIAPFEELPVTRSLDLVRGLDDWSGAQYVHWVAEKQAIKPLQEIPRINAGRVEGQCARVSRELSGHPKMIEVAVGIARKGMDRLDRSLQQLDGPLEKQLLSLLQTGLALVGEEGHRLWGYLPLFPAGRLMPEALESAIQAIAAASASESDPAAPAQLPDWVEEGLDQLEHAAFLDFDTDTQTYDFHQSVLEHARREGGLTAEELGSGAAALLVFYAGYLGDNSERHDAIDRCLDNALPLMEQAWQSRSGDTAELDQVLARAADALGYYFQQRGLWVFGQRWQERAVVLHKAAENIESLAHALYKQALFHDGRGEPLQARKVLAESITLWEGAKNRKGLSASLHQLAILEVQAGELDRARDLWNQSIAIKKTQGDISGQAASYIMLAQLEASQGNFDGALPMAREAVDLLQRIGSGQVAQARKILQSIEAMARGQGNPAPATGLGAMLQALQTLPADKALAQIDTLLAQVKEAAEKAQLWLIRSALCWNHDDRAGCLQSIAEAEQCLASLPPGQRAPLDQAIQAARAQITQATSSTKAESVRLHEEAVTRLQAEQHQDALTLFEASLSASRTEQNPANIAINLFMIGQTLLLLNRPTEAMTHLQEGLGIATELNNEELLQAIREVAAIAAQLAKS